MRKYRSYKFTNRKHSKGGVRSSIAAGIALLCTLLSVYFAYAAKGNGGKYLVLFGVIAIAGSIYGFFEGKKSFQEEECFYLFSRIGTGVSLVLAIFWIAVAGMGYMM